MIEFPFSAPALRVEQPIGVFYVAILPARLLLTVAFSDTLSATLRHGENVYDLKGTQRSQQEKRLPLIADYINRTDAAFPNSIILAANYRGDDGLMADDDPEEGEGTPGAPGLQQRWTVDENDDGSATLTIPSAAKLAAVIDGQHRLFAFTKAFPKQLDMSLICSIFLDLPKPYQAQLFATINSTQKRVDKSLTYELFGYNVNEEEERYWSPDKLAVFLTRKLSIDEKSPLSGRIVIAPRKDEALTKLAKGKSWRVSTAVVVEGIMRLFTSNPKKDTTNLLAGSQKARADIGALRKDKSPLRDVYLSNGDVILYTLTLNYLVACEAVFWGKAPPESFITKTVGVQALFDILRRLALPAYLKKDISAKTFTAALQPAAEIDFASDEFRNASGSGRSAIRQAIEAAIFDA